MAGTMWRKKKTIIIMRKILKYVMKYFFGAIVVYMVYVIFTAPASYVEY